MNKELIAKVKEVADKTKIHIVTGLDLPNVVTLTRRKRLVQEDGVLVMNVLKPRSPVSSLKIDLSFTPFTGE